jgi:2-keto-4-pentenoate hydratase/2-oxohepta-3-ene-1,7-dioic acid hydratase in catechol pathway
MKLLSLRREARDTYGVLVDGGVIDLGLRFAQRWADLRALLADPHGLDAVRDLLTSGVRADLAVADVDWQPVIPVPGKIICIGHNYEAHRRETERAKTEYPSVFLRLPATQVGHRQAILRPRESTMLDYEGEIAIVIGRGGRRIPESEAWAHVAGYAPYNDASVRDWQWHTTQFAPGKNFLGTGAFGPWMVTADEIAPGQVLGLRTRLNGEVMQSADTSQMIFPIPRLIAYCSTFLPLEPGDVIVTGTPGGVGAKRQPPVFLKEGDRVEVEIDHVGLLVNRVALD